MVIFRAVCVCVCVCVCVHACTCVCVRACMRVFSSKKSFKNKRVDLIVISNIPRVWWCCWHPFLLAKKGNVQQFAGLNFQPPPPPPPDLWSNDMGYWSIHWCCMPRIHFTSAHTHTHARTHAHAHTHIHTHSCWVHTIAEVCNCSPKCIPTCCLPLGQIWRYSMYIKNNHTM